MRILSSGGLGLSRGVPNREKLLWRLEGSLFASHICQMQITPAMKSTAYARGLKHMQAFGRSHRVERFDLELMCRGRLILQIRNPL